jgi:hypothetical protein
VIANLKRETLNASCNRVLRYAVSRNLLPAQRLFQTDSLRGDLKQVSAEGGKAQHDALQQKHTQPKLNVVIASHIAKDDSTPIISATSCEGIAHLDNTTLGRILCVRHDLAAWTTDLWKFNDTCKQGENGRLEEVPIRLRGEFL